MQQLYALDDKSTAFPPIAYALTEPNGLLAIGGDLSPKRIVNAYRHGIFPWFSEQDPILWWSPDPRAIIETKQICINRSLRKFLKKSPYTVTIDKAFSQVIANCANAIYRSDGTWILPPMIEAYQTLHQEGFAHSIEVWQEDKLVGGLYGLSINGYFSGESMFHLAPNASKLALVYLAEKLSTAGVNFIDCQLQNPFLASMGCKEVTRETFIKQKNAMLSLTLPANFWLS